MSEHTYLPHMPKDSPIDTARQAWEILDAVKPDAIPIIIRFYLHGRIMGTLERNAAIIAAAEELASFVDTCELEKLNKVCAIVPGLPEKIIELQVAMMRYRRP